MFCPTRKFPFVGALNYKSSPHTRLTASSILFPIRTVQNYARATHVCFSGETKRPHQIYDVLFRGLDKTKTPVRVSENCRIKCNAFIIQMPRLDAYNVLIDTRATKSVVTRYAKSSVIFMCVRTLCSMDPRSRVCPHSHADRKLYTDGSMIFCQLTRSANNAGGALLTELLSLR